jgi:hypothetical protein
MSSDTSPPSSLPRNQPDWILGDILGLPIPAHSDALREGGTEFLTAAFRAAGTMGQDNQVSQITLFADCPGGSTGRKIFLSIAYEKPAPALPTDLFVKFSRDFDDEIRDRGKNQMAAEIKFALLSRAKNFPITVPACLFADYHDETGSGILITERIPFGKNGIEKLYEKCRDDEMPEPLEHYKTLVKSLARLAGSHKGGSLSHAIAQNFPFDAAAASQQDRIRYSAQQLQNRIARYAVFAETYPQLLPSNIRDKNFIAQLAADVPRFLEHETRIKQYLHGNPDFIALCHWNANIDNAWFWRNQDGALACGLLDWGRVSQMNIALALFGGLSASEISMWDNHLDTLLTLFVTEYHHSGGPVIALPELKRHLFLVAAMMWLAWLIDAPVLIERQIPDLARIKDRYDPCFAASETARVQLHMFSVVLNLWQTRDFGAMLDGFLRG